MQITKLFLAFFIGILLFAPLREARPHAVNGNENHDMVAILDAELRKAIAGSFVPPKDPTDPITADDMKVLTEIDADGPDIRHLTGLEHAINLTELQLLRGIPQTRVELDARPRFNLEPLAGLTELEYLTLQGVVIFDMAPLANLTKLKQLSLRYTYGISNIPDLSKLTALVHLRLDTNRITDISGVRGLTNLRQLSLAGNANLSDISPVANLRNLEVLRLDSTDITRESLSAVLRVFSTDVDQMTIDEYPRFTARSGVVGFGNTNISDLSVLDSLPNVFLWGLYLRFMGTQSRGTLFFHLTDLTPLVDLMDKGKVINQQTAIFLGNNYGLDYASLYEDIPALITGSRRVEYVNPAPMLEREFPKEASYRGHPRTRYTFSVRAVNTNPTFPESWLSLTPHGTAHNRQLAEAPVTFTVTAPDGNQEILDPVKTGRDGLSRVDITLGNDGETHTVTAVVPANVPTQGPQHAELRVEFTVTADSTVPPPPPSRTDPTPRLTVSFEDYPEEKPIDEFTLTLRFSEPVIGFEKADILVETALENGDGDATLVDLTPETPIHPDRTDPDPIQRYTATVELPARARGTVKLIVGADAATGSILQERGPSSDTASDSIEFGRRRVYVYPSHVAMDTLIFNEFRNAEDDKNDWVELKNISDEPVSLVEWEVSLVLPHAISPAASLAEIYAMDRDIVVFPDYTLPPGGILLIVNADPSENDLIRGQDIANPKHNPARPPYYLLAPDMKLPQTPYLLILRSKRDQNGKPAAFEDLLGNYHKHDVNYRTQIWPLRDTYVYTGTGARFSVGDVYQRVMLPKGSIPMRPMARGYFHDAWVLSESQSGLGYDPGVSPETSLGTPGYATRMEDGGGTGEISISEVMFATRQRGFPSQWIELYNNSATEVVDLEGWQLRVEVRDSQPVHRHTTFRLKALEVLPKQTVVLVARQDRSSGNIPVSRLYDVQRQNRQGLVLRSEGFAVRLLSRAGVLVDRVGNLDGRVGRDKPRWALPAGWSEDGSRTSLIRRYEAGQPFYGTGPGSWVRAADTALIGPYTYYGVPTDNGTPGYRQGSPLPVTLSQFRADRTETGVVVNWTTQSEMENAGFYVLRRLEGASDFERITPSLIAGAGTTAERSTYTYRDTTAKANVAYYYRLEEVSLSGVHRTLATVRLQGHVSGANKLLWKWADVKVEE